LTRVIYDWQIIAEVEDHNLDSTASAAGGDASLAGTVTQK